MSETSSAADASLADLFKHCAGSFKELYLALAIHGYISLSNFNDQYGRFGVWGVDSGADRTGRGSLDDLLRNDPNQRLIVSEMLTDLYSDLKRCTSLVKESSESHNGTHAPELAGEEWYSDGDSSVDSSSDSDSFLSKQRDPINRRKSILRLLAIVVDHIQSLYKASALLRRPKVSNKYLRSLAKHRGEFIESDAKREQHIEHDAIDWDIDHIAEKIRQWARNAAKVISDPKNYICIRLAAANMRRREQLKYWQDHPDRASSYKPQPILLVNPSLKSSDNPLVDLKFYLDEGAAIAESEHRASKATKATRQSFSTVALSDLNDAITFSGRPRTEYVASIHGRRSSLRVPDIPKVPPELPNFECPYCFASLEIKAMSQRDVWKKHVFRDLRPYVCTFEYCQNPEKLYMTRHDWIYHEMQMHRRQWLCPGCNHKFASGDLLKSHLLTMHSTLFTIAQLAPMIDICQRPLEMEEISDCPLCPVTFPLSVLQPHLAAHLEELALFVLPINVEDRSHDAGSEDVEQVSDHAAGFDRASSGDELSEPEFEDTSSEIVSSQDPEAFKTLVGIAEKPVMQLEDWLLETETVDYMDDRVQNTAAIEEPTENTHTVDLGMMDRRYHRPRSPPVQIPARSPLPAFDPYIRDIYSMSIRNDEGPTGAERVPVPGPIVTTTYKIKPEFQAIHEPTDHTSSRQRRLSLDGSSIRVIDSEPRSRPIIGRARRPPSGEDGEYISIPASSGKRHSYYQGYATIDNANIERVSDKEGGSRGALGVNNRREDAKYLMRHEPMYPNELVRHPDTVADDYGDDGYGYTNPRDFVQYDLSRPTGYTPLRRNSDNVSRSSRPISISGYKVIESYPSARRDPGPPPTTRGLDKLTPYDALPARKAPIESSVRSASKEQFYDTDPPRKQSYRKPVSIYQDQTRLDDYDDPRDDGLQERSVRREYHEDQGSVDSTGRDPKEQHSHKGVASDDQGDTKERSQQMGDKQVGLASRNLQEKTTSSPTTTTPPELVREGLSEQKREPGNTQTELPTFKERGRRDTSDSEEYRRPTPRLVSPPREVQQPEENKPRGILRPPRENFPEDPTPIREEVAPLKDAKRDGIPPDARWTKISRHLVSPEALDAGKERYEAREDFVIVLRVLTKEEIQAFAVATQQIRDERNARRLEDVGVNK